MNKEQNVNYTYNIIKKNIKIFRKEKKITQEKLAELINISSDYMNEIESYRKEKRFSIRILCDISLTLNIPIYLFLKTIIPLRVWKGVYICLKMKKE